MCACHGRGVGDEGHGQQRMCGADVNGLTPVPRTNSAAAGNEPMSNAAEVFHATPAHVPTNVQDGDSHSQSTLREATSLRPFAASFCPPLRSTPPPNCGASVLKGQGAQVEQADEDGAEILRGVSDR